jgi:hypothetical protein
MKTIAIYAGRFHPFHKGHKASYDFLTKQFGADNVYIATSNAQAPLTSPFSFEEKKKMAELTGVPADKIIQVKNPYQAKEITSKLNPEDTQLVFALSEKDIDRFTFTKKDGTPGYIQPYPKNDAHLALMDKHAYAFLTPTVKFKVAGKNADSASAIRKAYIDADKQGRKKIVSDLYGAVNKDIEQIFDKKLSITEELSRIMTTLKEGTVSKQDKNMRKIQVALEMEREVKAIEEADLSHAKVVNTSKGHRIVPSGGIGSWDFDGLRKSVVSQLDQMNQMVKSGNLTSAYYTLYQNGALEKKLQALELYQQWLDTQGDKPLPLDQEIDLIPEE